MPTNKQERVRVDIWTSLRPVIEGEMQRSGLSAQEVVNIALVEYFGLSPNGKKQVLKPVEPTSSQKPDDSEDYI